MRCLLLLILIASSTVAPSTRARAEKPETAGTARDATAGPQWERRNVAGWTVFIDDRLRAKDPQKLATALILLESQLREIVEALPKDRLAHLREVPLWFSPTYNGFPPKAEYHPNVNWLKKNGRDPAMAKGVEFSNIEIFEQETRRMPNFALHELAHAYHDRVLGYDHERIKSAFERAEAAGKYERVLRQNHKGERRYDRAYALTNEKEYFAEATEAFISSNDFFPFNRKQLQQHDPVMEALLQVIWLDEDAQ